jgi:hypothetical protein
VPEDHRKQNEDAVQAVRREEGKSPLPPEDRLGSGLRSKLELRALLVELSRPRAELARTKSIDDSLGAHTNWTGRRHILRYPIHCGKISFM